MSDFPFAACPAIHDLRRFIAADESLDRLTNVRVAKHVANCPDCENALRQIIGFDGTIVPIRALSLNEEWGQALDRQRAHMANAIAGIGPAVAPGQIWTARLPQTNITSGGAASLSPLVVVLRRAKRPFSNEELVDIAPVTEDPGIAVEWSLIFSENDTDCDSPVVAHLDFQVTTGLSALQFCVGNLSELAVRSLHEALELYDSGSLARLPLLCGAFGESAVRSGPRWFELQADLERLTSRLAKFVDIQADDDAASSDAARCSVDGPSSDWCRKSGSLPSKFVVYLDTGDTSDPAHRRNDWPLSGNVFDRCSVSYRRRELGKSIQLALEARARRAAGTTLPLVDALAAFNEFQLARLYTIGTFGVSCCVEPITLGAVTSTAVRSVFNAKSRRFLVGWSGDFASGTLPIAQSRSVAIVAQESNRLGDVGHFLTGSGNASK